MRNLDQSGDAGVAGERVDAAVKRRNFLEPGCFAASLAKPLERASQRGEDGGQAANEVVAQAGLKCDISIRA